MQNFDNGSKLEFNALMLISVSPAALIIALVDLAIKLVNSIL